MDQIEPQCETKLLADEMHRSADARGGVIVTTGVRFDEFDQFLDACRRHGRMDPKAKSDLGGQRDRVEIATRIVGNLLVEARIDDEGIGGH